MVTILADSFLEDLGSTNGTLVNGKPVTKHFLRDATRSTSAGSSSSTSWTTRRSPSRSRPTCCGARCWACTSRSSVRVNGGASAASRIAATVRVAGHRRSAVPRRRAFVRSEACRAARRGAGDQVDGGGLRARVFGVRCIGSGVVPVDGFGHRVKRVPVRVWLHGSRCAAVRFQLHGSNCPGRLRRDAIRRDGAPHNLARAGAPLEGGDPARLDVGRVTRSGAARREDAPRRIAAPRRSVAPPPVPSYRVRVLTGPSAGREIAVSGDSVTVGRVGVQVACIVQQHGSWRLGRLEGERPLALNGQDVPADGAVLCPGDHFEVAGVQLAFESS